jgi:hypothetical protein
MSLDFESTQSIVEKKIENCQQEMQAAQIFIQKQQRWWHFHFLYANFLVELENVHYV